MQTNNEYVTVKDAAEMLGISPNTLRSWGALGTTVAYRPPSTTVDCIEELILKSYAGGPNNLR
jgi:hypothetical protein